MSQNVSDRLASWGFQPIGPSVASHRNEGGGQQPWRDVRSTQPALAGPRVIDDESYTRSG